MLLAKERLAFAFAKRNPVLKPVPDAVARGFVYGMDPYSTGGLLPSSVEPRMTPCFPCSPSGGAADIWETPADLRPASEWKRDYPACERIR